MKSRALVAIALVAAFAITLSSLRLFNLGQLNETQTVTAIAIAFLSNVAFKFGMIVFIGGWTLARQVAIGFGAMAVGVLFGLLIV